MEKNCEVIQITTPDKYLLDGLWFGGSKAKKAFVLVHGLSSSAFSNRKMVEPLATSKTAVITFNNRGNGKIAKIKKLDARKKRGYTSKLIGEAHEVFEDCVHDLQGVVDFLRKRRVKEIYLVGHSTGCQKSIYYLSQRGKQKLVKGVVLLAPVSDYTSIGKFVSSKNLKRTTDYANKLVKEKKEHTLLPLELWPGMHDAQRFLSLYTPDSSEEIFTYGQPEKIPQTLQKVKTPILALFAEKDEYQDRPARKIAKWFEASSRSSNLTVKIIKGALHSYSGYENKVVQEIAKWRAPLQ